MTADHRIFKYPLDLVDTQTILVHRGAIPLCVQVQNGIPCLWAIVDLAAATGGLTLRIIGTGHPIDDDLDSLTYLDTFQMMDGALVFHVFRIRRAD